MSTYRVTSPNGAGTIEVTPAVIVERLRKGRSQVGGAIDRSAISSVTSRSGMARGTVVVVAGAAVHEWTLGRSQAKALAAELSPS